MKFGPGKIFWKISTQQYLCGNTKKLYIVKIITKNVSVFMKKPLFFHDFDKKIAYSNTIKKSPFLHRPRNAIFSVSRTHVKSIYQISRSDFCRKFAGFAGFYKPSNAIISSRNHDKIQ